MSTHIGRKIVRIRELRGIKQETLAEMLNVSQSTVSRLEQQEEIEDDKLQEIAAALSVTPTAIRNFNEDAAISQMNNVHNNHDHSINAVIYYEMSSAEEVRKIYEKALQAEQEKSAALQLLVNHLTAENDRLRGD